MKGSGFKYSICIITVVIILLVTFLYFYFGLSVNTKTIAVENVILEDNSFYMKGTSVDSSKAFVGYTYETKNNNLYLTLKYTIVNNFRDTGDFEIKIINKFNNVSKVILKGKDVDDLKVIWTKTSKSIPITRVEASIWGLCSNGTKNSNIIP